MHLLPNSESKTIAETADRRAITTMSATRVETSHRRCRRLRQTGSISVSENPDSATPKSEGFGAHTVPARRIFRTGGRLVLAGRYGASNRFAPGVRKKGHHDSGDQREALRPLRRLTKDQRGVAYRRRWQAKARRSGPTNRGQPISHL